MQYDVHTSQAFKKSLKRVKQYKNFKPERLRKVISLLAEGKSLPQELRDHALTGSLKGYRECHSALDILLIYTINDDVLILTLVNIGSHAHLFKT